MLLADRSEVSDALAAVGEHHRQITDHPARIMTTTPLLEHRQSARQRTLEPDRVRDLGKQRAAGMRHQPRSVRRDFYRYPPSVTHHPQGETPSSRFRTSTIPRIPAVPDVPAPSVTPRARVLPHGPG